MGNQSHYQEEQAISDLLSLLSDPNLNLDDASAQTLAPGEQAPADPPSGENPIAPHRDRSNNTNNSRDFPSSAGQTDGDTLPADVMAALNTVMPPVEQTINSRRSSPNQNPSPNDPSPVLPPWPRHPDDSSSANSLEGEDLSAIDANPVISLEPREDLGQETLESQNKAALTQRLPLDPPTNGADGVESVDELIDRLLQAPVLPTLPTVDPVEPISDLAHGPTVTTPGIPPRAGQEPVDASTYQLQNLLTELIFPDREADALKIKEQADVIHRLEKELNRVQTQLNDPQEMIELLLPLIADLLSLKITESRDDVIRAIGPIIDQLITTKTHQDKVAMINAIAEIVPGAISKKISDNPAEIVQSIAPAMGESIRAQILLERDSMVNALYPVIGDTIKKYMKEWVDKINQQLENSLTLEGLQRKIKAKIKGVPEMNLIMRETMPFFVNAVFLIHKESGLIIAEAQREGEGLEGDMLGGMLTAIRSFASECTVSESTTSELKEIEYETFSILMEVAGYYYTAVVIEGDYTSDFLDEMRSTLSTIVLNFHSPSMKDYDGDPDSVPKPVHNLIENLLNYQEEQEKQEKRFPWAFLGLGAGALVLGTGLLGWQLYRHHRAQHYENQAAIALASTPAIAVYRLDTEFKDQQLILKGKLPSDRMRQQAELAVQQALPELELNNQIMAVQVPPDPGLIAAEVDRLTQVFNQMDSVIIDTHYTENQIVVSGHIRNTQELGKIRQAFTTMPGIEQVIITLTPKAFPIDQRIYFNHDSSTLNVKDIEEKVATIKTFLQIYPEIRLQIIGHADRTGLETHNRNLANNRAEAVAEVLINQGIAKDRLVIIGDKDFPPGVEPRDSLWKSRCVRFARVIPSTD